MTGLAPFVAAALLGDTLLLVVYATLLRVDRSPHLRLWTLAWALSWVRYAASLVALSMPSQTLEVVMLLASLGSAAALLAGAYAFSGRSLNRAWRGAFAAAGLWVVLAEVTGAGFLALTMPVFGLLGGAMLVAGRALWHAPIPAPKPATRMVAVALIAWGLHRLNYPLLRPVEWFAPIGFSIAAALELVVAVGSALAHAERVRFELQKSEARYRQLVDNAPQGIFHTSVEGRFVAANPALVRMLGYASEAELLTLDIARDLYADPDARARLQAAHEDSDVTDGFEAEWRKKDGGTLRVALYGRKIRDRAGTLIG